MTHRLRTLLYQGYGNQNPLKNKDKVKFLHHGLSTAYTINKINLGKNHEISAVVGSQHIVELTSSTTAFKYYFRFISLVG